MWANKKRSQLPAQLVSQMRKEPRNDNAGLRDSGIYQGLSFASRCSRARCSCCARSSKSSASRSQLAASSGLPAFAASSRHIIACLRNLSASASSLFIATNDALADRKFLFFPGATNHCDPSVPSVPFRAFRALRTRVPQRPLWRARAVFHQPIIAAAMTSMRTAITIINTIRYMITMQILKVLPVEAMR